MVFQSWSIRGHTILLVNDPIYLFMIHYFVVNVSKNTICLLVLTIKVKAFVQKPKTFVQIYLTRPPVAVKMMTVVSQKQWLK